MNIKIKLILILSLFVFSSFRLTLADDVLYDDTVTIPGYGGFYVEFETTVNDLTLSSSNQVHPGGFLSIYVSIRFYPSGGDSEAVWNKKISCCEIATYSRILTEKGVYRFIVNNIGGHDTDFSLTLTAETPGSSDLDFVILIPIGIVVVLIVGGVLLKQKLKKPIEADISTD